MTELSPLPLNIRNGLVGGSDGCNGFGERPNGEMVSTMVGCDGTRGAFAEALRAAVVTTPDVVEGQLRFATEEVTLAYEVWVEVLASELFSILDSDSPNLDSTTIAFEQSGKPLNYRRFIRLEDGGHPAEFYVGYKTPDGLAFHIDILEDPAASRTLGNLARRYRTAAPSHWAGDVRASLIPDSYLDENNIGILSRRGELNGNLLIFDESQTTGESFELTNRRGESLSVVVPTNARLVTGR
ncbi:MAG: hypothetical protein R8J94_00520 [Acidimicrobiia bacterium]|nr:hypothetical protein [Acidimicrobiia bacterium]